MGGKTHADNQQIVEEQQKQAADAAAKEAARQQRINTGLKRIDQAFGGKPVTAPVDQTFNWKTFNATSALPPGYTRGYVDAKGNILKDTPAAAAYYSQNAGAPGTASYDAGRGSGGTGFGGMTTSGGPGETYHPATAAVSAANQPGAQLALIDSKGRVVKPGTAINYITQQPTGQTTGGFDDTFYNNYGKAITDYYDPQVDTQYSDAQKELTYRLARAGTAQSSAANTENVKLDKQYSDNLAAIANKADTAVGDLKAKVAGEKQKAVSQLYATEDPNVAANQATAAVRDISLTQPDLSPLAQVFNIATVGAANILKNYNNQQLIGNFNAGLPSSQGSGRVTA